MTEQWSPEASLRLDRSAQVPLIAGLAACVGIAIGCSGPWVEFAVFSISGLDIRAWGKIWIGVALVSAALLGVVLSAQRFRLRPQVALSLLWGVFVAAVACAAFAFPYVIRVLTLPRTEFLGLSIGANVGWGLWLLALSAGALGVAAAMAANQVGRVCDAVAASWGAPSVTRRYRQIALALAVTVTVGWIGYYGSTWDGGPPGSDSAGKRAGSEWPLGDQPDSESSSSAAPTYATVGEPIQLGDFQVEVLGIWLQKVIGDGFRSYEPRGIWVVAVMEVTNTGSEEQSFDTDGQELIVDGRTYSSNTWAAKYVASEVYQFLVLNPGLSEYAVAVFDVPPGIFPASEAALNLKSDSGGPDVRLAGATFLIGYALLAARRALRPTELTPSEMGTAPLSRVVQACLIVTFLNPSFYVDTALIGTLASEKPDFRWFFGAGAWLASAIWFSALGYGSGQLQRFFATPAAWRVLDGLIAVIMIGVAVVVITEAHLV